ncbi:multidrug effflux MFS transporter [Desulfovibrio sp. OttesenSCG-928-I05]|nr:multidrug effflux MFS transporter [Desulfovibrio sp. OttesenSCG-928-I05]
MSCVTKKTISDGRFALSLAMITLLAPTATDLYLASMLDIAEALDVTYASVQLTLTVFLLAQGAGQLFFGPLIDRYGRRIPLLAGIAVFALGSVWAGCSGSFTSLLVSRFVQGISGALLLVVGFSSVRDRAQGADAARLFAILLTIEGLAPIFAPIAGGYIDTLLGWRAVLWTSAVMAVLTFANSFISLPESLPASERIPLEPAVISSTYRRILRDRAFLLPCLALSATFFFLFAYIAGGAFLYQDVYKLTPDSFGLVFGITGGAVMLGAMASGRLVKTRKVSAIAILGILLIIAGTTVSFIASLTVGLYGIVPGFMIAMFGLGMAEPTLVSLTMASQSSALGFTAALMGSLHLMLSSLSTPLSGYLLPLGTTHWFIFLLLSALGALCIALAARRYAVEGESAPAAAQAPAHSC